MEKRDDVITEEEFQEFLSAKTYEEQVKILIRHSEKNRKAIEKRDSVLKSDSAQIFQDDVKR